MLGYIPRTANEQFCALMDQGYSDMFEARIQRITPDSHMEHQVGVIVYLFKKSVTLHQFLKQNQL